MGDTVFSPLKQTTPPLSALGAIGSGGLAGNARAIRNRIAIILMGTGVFILLAALGLYAASRGSHFHQLNINHLNHTVALEQTLRMSLDPRDHVDRIERELSLILDQPRACLNDLTAIDHALMRLTGAEKAIQLCVDDLAIGYEAEKLIERYRAGGVSDRAFVEGISAAAVRFVDHSRQFEGAIARMVEIVVRYAFPALLLMAAVTIAAIVAASRGIARTVEEIIRSRRALETTEKILGVCIDSLGESFSLWGEDNRLIVYNAKFEEINRKIIDIVRPGLLFEDLLQALVDRGVLPMAEAEKERYIAERRAVRGNKDTAFEQYRDDGNWYLLKESPVPGVGTAVVAINVTALKTAEEDLKRKQAELTIALENMPHGLCLYDRDLNFIQFNKAFQSLYGFPNDFFNVRRNITEGHRWLYEQGVLIPSASASDEAPGRKRIRDILEGHGDGMQYLSNGTAIEVTFGNWEDDMVVGVYKDVTEQKKAEEALRRAQSDLEALVAERTEEVTAGREELTQRLRELNCLYAISQVASDPNLSLAEFCRQTVEALPSGWANPERLSVRLSIGDIMFTSSSFRESSWHVSVPLGVGKDRLGLVELFITGMDDALDTNPMTESGQELLREIANRIAEAVARRRNEQALQTAKNAAEAASRAKSTFLSAMSHEIRTPMNGVLGMIDLLSQTKMDKEQNRMLGTTRESANALLRIIDDVLDFSKVEAGKLEIEHTQFRPPQLIESVYENLEPLARAKGISLVAFADPRIPELLLGDGLRVRQILLNLGNNAIKFTNQGEIAITAEVVHNRTDSLTWIRFKVSDTGIGIEQADVRRLFQPFTQAEISTTRRFGGTGLGLPISARLAGLMGGRLLAKSKPGAGSTFIADLPFDPVDNGLAGARAPVEDLSGLPVTLLGFHPRRLGYLRRLLRHCGAEVAIVRRPNDPRAADIVGTLAKGQLVAYGDDWPEPGADSGPDSRPNSGNEDAEGTVDGLLKTARDTLDLYFLKLSSRPATLITCGPSDTDPTASGGCCHSGLITAVTECVGQTPVGPKRLGDIPYEPVSPQPLPLHRGKLLVAEDNEINREVISRQLTNLRFEFDIFEDGDDALEAWKRNTYTLVLTDCHMPNMDGFELTRVIRRDRARGGHKVPIIAVTANALQGEEERCLTAGMSAYLAKPLKTKQLHEALCAWLPASCAACHTDLCPIDQQNARDLGPLEALPEAVPPNGGAGPAEDEIIDLSILRDMLDDENEVWDMLGRFVATSHDRIREIEDAIAAGTHKQGKAAAHKFKSGARSVGAVSLSEICQKIEDACAVSQTSEASKHLAALQEASDAFRAYVDHQRGAA